jgi:hypothetical protein
VSDEDTDWLLKKSRQWWENATEAERQAMTQAQCESWARSFAGERESAVTVRPQPVLDASEAVYTERREVLQFAALPAPNVEALQARLAAAEADKRWMMAERDRTFTLMLARVQEAEARRAEAAALLAAAKRYDAANDSYDEDNADAMREWRAARVAIKAAIAAMEKEKK